MSETTTEEQIKSWKTELAASMDDQKWRRALRLCSWLRYALDQHGSSDPQVEQIHNHAKKALAEQVSQDQAEQVRQKKRHHLRSVSTNQITLGHWLPALDTIEAFYHNETNREETLDLMQSFQDRLLDRLSTAQQPTDTQAIKVKQRFNHLLGQIRSEALMAEA